METGLLLNKKGKNIDALSDPSCSWSGAKVEIGKVALYKSVSKVRSMPISYRDRLQCI